MMLLYYRHGIVTPILSHLRTKMKEKYVYETLSHAERARTLVHLRMALQDKMLQADGSV